MAKLGATGTRFQETLARANQLPMDPPDAVIGRIHNEGDRWWRYTAEHGWTLIVVSPEERSEYELQVAVQQTEYAAKIAEALAAGMKGELEASLKKLSRPPRVTSDSSGWYEATGAGIPPARPVTLKVTPRLRENGYQLEVELGKFHINDEVLRCTGWLSDGELAKRATTITVYAQWMRFVGSELARYIHHQGADDGEQGRTEVLEAFQSLAERGILMERYDWMDNPDLKNDVDRAILSITKED